MYGINNGCRVLKPLGRLIGAVFLISNRKMYLEDYIYNKPVIETVNLILRPFRISDVESLKEWMADKSIYDYWSKKPGKTDKNPSLLFQKEERPSKVFHLGIEHRSREKWLASGATITSMDY